MGFTHRGHEYDFTRTDVETRMRGIEPDRIYKHYVQVNGRDYPVKQVARACMGVHEQKTNESQRFLRSAGFDIQQMP